VSNKMHLKPASLRSSWFISSSASLQERTSSHLLPFLCFSGTTQSPRRHTPLHHLWASMYVGHCNCTPREARIIIVVQPFLDSIRKSGILRRIINRRVRRFFFVAMRWMILMRMSNVK
jgi:hypothetical protein